MIRTTENSTVWCQVDHPQWGAIAIQSNSDGLALLRFGDPDDGPSGDPHNAVAALQSYFEGDIDAIDTLPIASGGTEFQQLCWAALRRIPSGTTTTYGALAASIGRPDAVRAVGTANGANPVAIVVPCHRVIGKNGHLVGYAGGLDRKRALLAHEGAPGFLVP